MPVKTKIMPLVKSVFKRAIFVLLGLIIINFIYLAGKIVYTASAQGVPNLISYQGRLYDTSGNLLGGAGTNYYFRFSIYDAASGGTKLWPAGTPSTMTYQVRYGVFNAQVGDTNAGGDALTLDFNDDTYFLQVEVASLANFSDGETLSPRQRITSAGYAKNADMVDGYHASTTPTANQVVALDGSGNLSFGTSNPVIQASNGLSLQTTVAGDINLTPAAGQVKIVSATTTQLTIGYDTNNRLDVKVSSAGAVTFDAVGSGAELIASDNFTVQGQIFVSGTATSTIAGDVNFDAGTLYVDSVNNRVGIGITSPAHTLSVNGTTNISGAVTLQSTLNVTGNTTLANTSSTNLTVTNNSYFNTITATGQTVLANASTTNLTVSSDAYIGTVRSGTWNGSIISPTYGGLGFNASSVQKGGIIAGTGAGTFGILAVGNNGLCLIASSTAANGVAWSDCATASGAITNLNGLSVSSQDFATSTSGGLDLFITSVGSTHTFTLQPASGYSVPLSASTTEWAGFYATPSTRISAGTGLSWSGNTLNAANAFTGSGTNGYVARWASSTGLTTGILVDNGTVAGVNATSSDYTFNIQGSSGVNPFNVASSTGDSLFNINQIGMVSIMGDVGIGTTTPYNPDGWNRVLDVSGGYHSKIITTVQDGNIQGGIYSHHLGYFGAPTGTMMGTYTDHPLSLITNSLARMIISNTGNVGIGTTTPAQTLAVAGSFRATGAFFDSSNASGTTGMLLQTTGTGTQWVTTSSLGIVSGVSSVTAGDGLGQDSTTGNLTVYVKPGTGITTSSDQISVDTNAQLTWTGTQTFANVSSTNLTVATDTYLNTLRTSGAILASSTLGVSGAVILHSTLNVQGQTSLVSVSSTNLTVSSNTYLASLNVSGAANFNSTLDVQGQTTLANASSTNLTVTSNAYFNTISATGQISLANTSSTNLTVSNNSYFNTLTATGQTILANASSTNFTVSGNSYLGTVMQGTWQGSVIAPTYGGLGFNASSVATGGLITGTGAGTFGILAVGNNGFCLTASSTASNGVAWSDCVTASGAITSLNGLTATTQTFATSTSGGLELNITSTGSVHTFALQPASGYTVPLSASTTEWSNFYVTPSTRINAGTGLTWSGNTLHAANEFTGTGITNYVARWASSTGLTTGVLVDIGTKVGIGTTSPSALFTVQATSTSDKTVLIAGIAGQTTNLFELQNAGSSQLLTIDISGRTVFTIATTTNALVVNQLGTGNIAQFQASGTPIFTIGQSLVTSEVPLAINSVGDTGIAGNLIFTNPTASYIKSDSPLYIQAGDIANNESLYLSGSNAGLVIVEDNFLAESSSTSAIVRVNQTGSGNILQLQGSGNDRLVVTTAGYVGIGSSTPTHTLAVQGVGGDIPFSVASSTGANLFIITQNGNVGIGTTTPAQTLTVVGGARVTGALYDSAASAGSFGMLLQTTGSGTQWVTTSSLGITGSLTGSGTNGLVARWTSASALSTGILQDSGTRAGVNATSSSYTFNIQGSSGVNPFNIASSSGSSIFNIDQTNAISINTGSGQWYFSSITNSFGPSIGGGARLGYPSYGWTYLDFTSTDGLSNTVIEMENADSLAFSGATAGYRFSDGPILASSTLGVTGATTLHNTLNVQGQTTLANASTTNLTVSGNLYGGTYIGSLNPQLTQGSVFFQGINGLTQDNVNFYWDDVMNTLELGDHTNLNAGLFIYRAATSSGTLYGQYIEATANGAGSPNVYGSNINTYTGVNVNDLYGMNILSGGLASAVLGDLVGIKSTANKQDNSNNNTGNVYAGYFDARYGANAYGLYVNAQNAATTSYAIYSAAGINYFTNALLASSTLSVTGATTLHNTLNVQGQTTLANASTTNLTVSTNTYLNTLRTSGAILASSTLYVTSGATFYDSVTIQGTTRLFGTVGDGANNPGAYGQVLMTTSSGVLWVTTSSLGIVSGGTPGGSSGQIQFNHGGTFAGDSGFTFNSSTDSVTIGGDLTVDTNTLFVNASTNRVGVGTSTPIARFSVQATAGEEALRISSSTGATLLVVDSGGNFNFDAGTLFVDVVNNRVGIGTTTPQTILDIVDPSGISTLRVKAGSSQGTNNLLEIQNVSGTNLAFVSSAGGIFTSSTLGVTGATLLHSTLNVQGQTTLANVSSTNITSSGTGYFNVLRATGQTTLANVSSTYFTVSSNAYLENATVASNLTGNGTTIFNDRVYFYNTIRDNSGSAGSYGNILMSTSTGVQWIATSSLGISGSLSGGTNGYVARWTSASTLSTGKFIDDGTVAGVNATSSSYTFNLQGNSGVNPFNVASSSGANLFTVLQTGRVGIGTSTPESELQVVGLIKSDILHIGGPTNTNQRFYVTSDNTGDNWPLAYIKESTSASTSTTRYAAYILNEGVGQQSASNYGLRVEATGASTASGVKNIAIIANGQNSYGSSGQNVGLQVSAAGHGVLGATSKAIEITGPTTHDDAWAIYSSATAKSYFAGALLASSTLSVTGATLLHSTLNVQGQTTLANASSTNLTVSSNAYFNTINATGQTTLANASSTNLTVSTNTYLNTLRTSGAILASSTLAVTGNADFYGANDFYGGVDFWGNTRLLSEVRDGNNSAGTYGMVLMTTSTGVQWVATSSLGISGGSLSGGTNGYVARWTSASSLSSGKLLDDGTVAGVNATSSSYTFNIQGNSGVSPFNIASSTGSSLLTVNQAGYVGVGTSTIPERLTIAGNTLILQEDKPTFIGNIGANLYSIFAMGDYVYGVGGGNQLEIYDVSKPSSIVQTAVDGSNLDNPVSLYVSGRYAYVLSLNNSTLQIFDISNPYSIVAKDYETSGLSSPTSIYVSGGYAYVTDLGNSTLQIYDISNPNNILVKDSITTGASSAPQDVYVVWPYAYVVDSVNTVLLIFDVSDPNNIVAKGSDSTSLASPNSIYVSGAYAYVTDDSNDILATYNISDPDTPTFLDNISTTNPVDAFVSGNYAYVVKSDGNSFSIYDVSDPANIISKNNYDVGVSYSVFVSGKYAYIGGDSYLTVLSLNNLTTPTLEAGAGYFGDLQVQDNALFNNDVMVSGGLNVGGDVSLQAGLKVISDAYINTVRVGLGSGNQAYNTALGREALNANTTGDYNTAVGRQALFLNTDGTGNTALGYSAGSYNGQSSGSYNTTIGMNTLYYNQTGNYNVYIGAEAGNNVGNAGSGNIVIGYDAGDNISSGNNNIVIGYSIDVPAPTVSNQMTIGNLLFGTNLDGTNTTISSGNIGIGTSTPIARLSVQAAAGQEALRISSSTGATLLAVETSGNFNFDSNTLYIDTINNRVGIGTNNPQRILDVYNPSGISTLTVREGVNQGSNNLFEIQTASGSSSLVFTSTSTQQLRVYATSSGYYVAMYHDGTNGNIESSAGSLKINNSAIFSGTIKTGGGTAQNYNSFGSGTPGQGTISSNNDVYVVGDLEVDGTAYLSGGTAWTQGDFAEKISIYEEEVLPGDLIVANDLEGETATGRLAYTENSNRILGVISTSPAGILKSDIIGEPLALTGTVPVKVTIENGIIRRGDQITTSATVPGAGMKATTSTAGTVGIALEDYTASSTGYVTILLNINNKIDAVSQLAQLPESEKQFENTTTTTSSTSVVVIDNSTTTIQVINNNYNYNNTQIVVIDYEELGNIKVMGQAEFTGLMKVVEAEVSGRILVKGDIIVAGDIDLSGAITTWFWQDIATSTATYSQQVELGDAVAIAGENTVVPMWANTFEFKPAVGIAVAIKSFATMTNDEIASMPDSLKLKYEEILAQLVEQNISTSTNIVISTDNEAFNNFKMVKVAISGIVKGYQNLIPGSRYYLALDENISQQKNLLSTNDDELTDLINQTDELLNEANELTSTTTENGMVAGEEEVIDNSLTKVSRTISYLEPVEQDAKLQVIGIAKSRSELLIQPSFNYSTYRDGYLSWEYGSLSTATNNTGNNYQLPIVYQSPIYNPPVEDNQTTTSTSTTTDEVIETETNEDLIVDETEQVNEIELSNEIDETSTVLDNTLDQDDSNLLQPAGVGELQGSL